MKPAGFEQRWARVIAGALVPGAAQGGTLGAVDLGAAFREDCADSPWYASWLMRVVLWLIWLSPVWRERRMRTFGGLDGAAQVRALDALLVHDRYLVRMAMILFKLTICTLLVGDPTVLARIGAYDTGRLRDGGAPPLELGRSARREEAS